MRRPWQRLSGRLSAAVGGPARARVVVMLASVLGLNSADSGAVGALADQLEQGLGINHTQLGLLATVSSAVGVAAALPVGVLADRSRRVRILVVVVAAWSAAIVAGWPRRTRGCCSPAWFSAWRRERRARSSRR